MLDVFRAADPLLLFLGASSALKLSLYYRWTSSRKPRPKPSEYVGVVTQCYLHPLKSGHGVQMDHLVCDFQTGPHVGVLADRHWMVADSDFQAATYKQFPKLVTVRPDADDDGNMVFRPPGDSTPIRINPSEVEEKGDTVEVSAYGVTFRGLDCGDAAAEWISEFVGKPGHRLVYAPPEFNTRRLVATGNTKYAAWTVSAKKEDTIAYQSVAPYHVMAEESLADLNSRLSEPVGVGRFRTNILVRADKPYTEDTWKEIMIGNDVRLSTVKLTGRCTFTCIDTENGVMKAERLKTLNSYRNIIKEPNFGPCLGVHMVLESPGTVKVGDKVYVTRGDNTVKP